MDYTQFIGTYFVPVGILVGLFVLFALEKKK